jgi:diguanylate cyclase (GGDEF)-like protein
MTVRLAFRSTRVQVSLRIDSGMIFATGTAISQCQVHSMRILLIEDHAHSAAAVHAGLEQTAIDYVVRHSPDLESAIGELKTGSFDAALIDLGLPDASGTEVAATVKSIAPSLPVVVLSGEDFEELGEDLMRLGIQDFLQKGQVSISRIDQSLRMACERQRKEDRLKQRAAYDELTGLANRAELIIQLRRTLSNARRRAGRVAVLAIELDDFKRVNDAHGRLVGDFILRQSANRLSAAIRTGDCAARVGGDEFIAVLESISNPAAIVSVARKISEALGKPVLHDGNDYRISVSIGIAIFPDHSENGVRLLELARQALCGGKQNGTGMVHLHEP